jgi:hypothetical protein
MAHEFIFEDSDECEFCGRLRTNPDDMYSQCTGECRYLDDDATKPLDFNQDTHYDELPYQLDDMFADRKPHKSTGFQIIDEEQDYD